MNDEETVSSASDSLRTSDLKRPEGLSGLIEIEKQSVNVSSACETPTVRSSLSETPISNGISHISNKRQLKRSEDKSYLDLEYENIVEPCDCTYCQPDLFRWTGTKWDSVLLPDEKLGADNYFIYKVPSGFSGEADENTINTDNQNKRKIVGDDRQNGNGTPEFHEYSLPFSNWNSEQNNSNTFSRLDGHITHSHLAKLEGSAFVPYTNNVISEDVGSVEMSPESNPTLRNPTTFSFYERKNGSYCENHKNIKSTNSLIEKCRWYGNECLVCTRDAGTSMSSPCLTSSPIILLNNLNRNVQNTDRFKQILYSFDNQSDNKSCTCTSCRQEYDYETSLKVNSCPILNGDNTHYNCSKSSHNTYYYSPIQIDGKQLFNALPEKEKYSISSYSTDRNVYKEERHTNNSWIAPEAKSNGFLGKVGKIENINCSEKVDVQDRNTKHDAYNSKYLIDQDILTKFKFGRNEEFKMNEFMIRLKEALSELNSCELETVHLGSMSVLSFEAVYVVAQMQTKLLKLKSRVGEFPSHGCKQMTALLDSLHLDIIGQCRTGPTENRQLARIVQTVARIDNLVSQHQNVTTSTFVSKDLTTQKPKNNSEKSYRRKWHDSSKKDSRNLSWKVERKTGGLHRESDTKIITNVPPKTNTENVIEKVLKRTQTIFPENSFCETLRKWCSTAKTTRIKNNNIMHMSPKYKHDINCSPRNFRTGDGADNKHTHGRKNRPKRVARKQKGCYTQQNRSPILEHFSQPKRTMTTILEEEFID